MANPSDYPATEVDTSGVYGNVGAAPRGTQDRAADAESSTFAAGGGGANVTTGGTLTGTPDTEGVYGGNFANYVPTPPPLQNATIGTDMVGWPQTPGVNPAYRAPTVGIGYIGAAGEFDTSHTDAPVSSGSGTPPVDSEYLYSGTLDSYMIGAGVGPTTTTLPSTPSAPTVVAGPRGVIVSWTDVSDPSGAPVKGYVILGSTGGTTNAAKNVTSVFVNDLVPDQSYTFKVAARNDNGLGVYSAASSAVSPYNPDVPADPGNPGGLAPYNQINPIYTPDGSIKAGTGGRPLAPTGLTLAVNSTTGNVVCNWTASAGIAPVGGYTVTLSNGATHNVANSVVTYTFTGQTSLVPLTGKVTAIGSTAGGNSDSATVQMTGDPVTMTAPTLVGAGATNLTASWSASSPAAANGYKVTLSSAQTHTVAAGVLTWAFTGLTTGTSTTAVVQAIGRVNQITGPASTAVLVP